MRLDSNEVREWEKRDSVRGLAAHVGTSYGDPGLVSAALAPGARGGRAAEQLLLVCPDTA